MAKSLVIGTQGVLGASAAGQVVEGRRWELFSGRLYELLVGDGLAGFWPRTPSR